MAMRNFWLEADVDGRETLVTGGPRAKDGGMYIRLYMRDEGCSVKACTIKCFVANDGNLAVDVFDDEGERVYCKTTER